MFKEKGVFERMTKLARPVSIALVVLLVLLSAAACSKKSDALLLLADRVCKMLGSEGLFPPIRRTARKSSARIKGAKGA
mgnify:CR=1 FL=1|jgi:hypothetical protein